MDLLLPTTTALNLTLEGSIGAFRIGGSATGAPRSVQVRYLETHIGFDPMVASNETMLRHLEPVRETFDFQALDFDQIMQRDIDDARVSTELVPYLLDAGAGGTIKFFPPVVIVVVPVEDLAMKPALYYPKVETDTAVIDAQRSTQLIRSGDVGAEAFQFEFPMIGGKPRFHDLARLKLNTNKVRLVIIDGQHRAMALLALYRNLKDDWNDARRLPFRDYYREWTKQRIGGFNLSELQLPVIVCTFPELDTAYAGDFDIIKAARSTFLTLNKNARKVSDSRNLLLNDSDLISHFLRDELGIIKKKDIHSVSSLRIWNVELDQYRDRTKIESPMACTGVTHVYYAIEHLMLDDHNVKGLGARTGKFPLKMFLESNLLPRLDGENMLGAAVAGSIRRDDFTQQAAEKLSEAFHDRYGQYLLTALETFKPFEIHNRAALEVESSLQGHANPQIRTILFEGQNIGRTFRDYLAHMERREKAAKKSLQTLSPEVQTTLLQLRGTKAAVEATRQRFIARRAELYMADFADKSKIRNADQKVSGKLRKPLDDLFDTVYSTVAFQAALLGGFFLVIEKAERRAPGEGATLPSRAASFAEYIAALNSFFVPSTFPRLRNLLRTFFYEIDGDRAETWTTVPSATTFNDVVFRGEMKPDEWPKYRYLLLELWSSDDPVIESVRIEERNTCRKQAFQSLRTKKMKELCVEIQKNEKDLTPVDWTMVFDRAYKDFDAFLKNLGLNAEERMSRDSAKAVDDQKEPEKEEPSDEDAEEPSE